MAREENSFGMSSLDLDSSIASSADSLSTSSTFCSSQDTSDLDCYDLSQSQCCFGKSKSKRITIDQLDPSKNRKCWSITAKVTFKSTVRTWSNPFSHGKYFHLDLRDETSTIRAVAFKKACDEFYPAIELNKVYNISGCKIQRSNKNYTNIPHEYQLVFEDRGVQLSQFHGNPNRSPIKASGRKMEYCEQFSTIIDIKRNVLKERLYGLGRTFNVDALIIDFINRDIDHVVYRGCPYDYCKKKVILTKVGNEDCYYCAKCGHTYPNFEYRYMLKVKIVDHTDEMLITIFESAEQLIGITAADLVQLNEKNPQQYYEYFEKNLLKRYYFVIEAKNQIYENEKEVNAVACFYKADYREISRNLIKKLQEIAKKL